MPSSLLEVAAHVTDVPVDVRSAVAPGGSGVVEASAPAGGEEPWPRGPAERDRARVGERERERDTERE